METVQHWEIKENLNEWKCKPCSCFGKIQCCKMQYLYKINTIPIITPAGIFGRNFEISVYRNSKDVKFPK